MSWAKRFNAVVWSAALTLGAGIAATSPAHADLDIASVPLHLTNGANPNLMFVLDDSGSMSQRTSFEFDRFNDLIHNIYSSDDNSIYYNPEVRYRPWINADGTYFPEAGIPSEGDLAAGLPDYYRQFMRDFILGRRAEPPPPPPPTLFHYYEYLGAGAREDIGNYERKLILPDTAPFIRGAGRDDCAASAGGGLRSCTFTEEVQNFANWFQYHSTRMRAAKAAIGYAFVDQTEAVRIGFARINQLDEQSIDGVDTPTIIRGVRAFDDDNRAAFFDTLYDTTPTGPLTPLLHALEQVGRYFERSDGRSPWVDDPEVGGGDQSSCRQNYALMMSDGAATDPWPRDAALAGNVDGSAGEVIVSADGEKTFQYVPEAPFADRWSGTLADVAMHFWKRDLRPDLDNNVPPLCFSEDCLSPDEDPAFWQHMVTYGVGFGVKGTLDPDRDLDDLAAGAKSWPDAGRGITAEGPRIDDMWHATVNSRGRYFSASDPQELAGRLQEALASIAARTSSSSALAANTTKLDAGALTFQGLFSASSWRGDLRAFKLDPDDGTIADQAWSAAAVMPAPDDRNIFTSDGGSGGVVFEWGALSGAQRAALDNDPELLAYLRGDQSLEIDKDGGRFRTRFIPDPLVPGAVLSPLGDIVNSTPFFTGAENFGLSVLSPEGGSYGAYLATKAQRPNMVYVNANDGMLHAFRASDGVELFAFMPDAILGELSQLADPGYRHRYFNDGPVRVSDAYIGGRWRTVLVGSLGAGGRAIYALDVTDPENFDENDVLWEFTDTGLGFPLGQPTVARTASGDWVAVISNGYNSDDHHSRLYFLNLASGSVLKEIDTGVGSAGNPNGMGTPLPVDLDADRITDAVYAGDLHGKLWKVDLTDSNPGVWGLLTDGAGVPSPLFSTHDEDGNPQPITGRPEAGRHPEHGVMVYFGTGKLFENGDQFDDAPQTLYGIWDQDLPVPPGDRDDVLQRQAILDEVLGHFGGEDLTFRVTTGETIDWSTKWGWYMDLTDVGALGAGERVVSNPVLRNGRIIFATVVPNADPCGSGGTSWLIELDAITGGRVTEPPFDLNEDGEFDADDMVEFGGDKLPPSGIKIADQLTTPVIVEVDRDVEVKHLGGASTAISTVRERAGGGTVRRHSWRQLQ